MNYQRRVFIFVIPNRGVYTNLNEKSYPPKLFCRLDERLQIIVLLGSGSRPKTGSDRKSTGMSHFVKIRVKKILDKKLKILFETDLFVLFRRKNARRLRFHYQIKCRAAQNAANCVLVPHPIFFNLKSESVSGHFRFTVVTRTPTKR